MKDLTLKFHDKLQFKAFLSSLGWAEDEDLQNKLLVDEIGFTYTETGVTEEGEPVCIRNDGYFVNIRILDDLFDVSVFSDYVVELETPLREYLSMSRLSINSIHLFLMEWLAIPKNTRRLLISNTVLRFQLYEKTNCFADPDQIQPYPLSA